MHSAKVVFYIWKDVAKYRTVDESNKRQRLEKKIGSERAGHIKDMPNKITIENNMARRLEEII